MKNSKIFVVILLLLTTLSFYSINKVDASSGNLSATTTIDLNVRAKSSGTAKILGTLKKGTKVLVHEKQKNGWSKITYNKKTAFVNSKYLKFGETSVKNSSWNGEYVVQINNKDYFEEGTLIIKNHSSEKFYFELEIGIHIKDSDRYFNGTVNGYATVSKDVAKVNFKDNDGLICKMTMTKTNNSIEIKEDTSNPFGGCSDFRGSLIEFDGTYKKN